MCLFIFIPAKKNYTAFKSSCITYKCRLKIPFKVIKKRSTLYAMLPSGKQLIPATSKLLRDICLVLERSSYTLKIQL